MLEFILELTTDIISKSLSLSKVDKETIFDEVTYALNQTRTHIRNTRLGNKDQASSHLSNVWQRTGKHLRRIRHHEIQELADIIEQKSKYWSDPDIYDLQNLNNYEMRLIQVETKLNNICK
ncbi:hypothetical protein [Maribellus sediminis]|uniref:hypothetical protein n=1 Tax=Maribellus sediminis TaxID=2696285 RepID=UPI00143036AE|nr:hypothetical protein [Maribellus sediminis]